MYFRAAFCPRNVIFVPILNSMGWSSQLAVLRGESASVKTLQGTIQALEHDKANLQERVQRLEKDLAAGPDTINKSSGKSGLNI